MNLPIIYIQLSLPDCRFKIGITGRGLMRRSRNIWESTPGLQFPIFFAVVPFPSLIERAMHVHFRFNHAPKRRGSGKTEWFRCGFLGVTLLEALAMLSAIWVVEGFMLFAVWKYYNNALSL